MSHHVSHNRTCFVSIFIVTFYHRFSFNTCYTDWYFFHNSSTSWRTSWVLYRVISRNCFNYVTLWRNTFHRWTNFSQRNIGFFTFFHNFQTIWNVVKCWSLWMRQTFANYEITECEVFIGISCYERYRVTEECERRYDTECFTYSSWCKQQCLRCLVRWRYKDSHVRSRTRI